MNELFPGRRRFLAVAAAVGALCASIAFGQTVPGRTLTLLVPPTPGGSVDAFARAVAARLPKFTDAAFVVDNRAGAGGNIGTAYVAKSAPRDGSVWLFTTGSTQAINSVLFGNAGFDPVADFEPVSGVAVVKHVVLVNNAVPAHSMADVIKLARNEPGKYAFTHNAGARSSTKRV